MGKWKWTVDAFVNPPDKVMKMFDAVLELVSEKAELTSLKVQDITTRAGIGKGTAYEYFDSREDIILFALLYDYSKKIQRLQQRFQKQDSFQEQCYLVMDWLVENGEYNSSFLHMLHWIFRDGDPCMEIQQKIPEEIFGAMEGFLLNECDAMLERAYQDGAIKETDVIKRRLAFGKLIMEVIFTQAPGPGQKYFQMNFNKMKDHAYNSLLKELS